MKEENKEFIIHDIASCSGGGESSKVWSVTNIKTGETHLTIEKTIRGYYPVQEYNNVMNKYKNIDGSGFYLTIEDIEEFRKTGRIDKRSNQA